MEPIIAFSATSVEEMLRQITAKIERLEAAQREANDEKMMTIEEAADYLGVNRSKLYRDRQAGILKSFDVGNAVRFRKKDLLETYSNDRFTQKINDLK